MSYPWGNPNQAPEQGSGTGSTTGTFENPGIHNPFTEIVFGTTVDQDNDLD